MGGGVGMAQQQWLSMNLAGVASRPTTVLESASQVVKRDRTQGSPIQSRSRGSAVVTRLMPQPDGTTQVEIGVDTSRIEAPARRYIAEQAAVEQCEEGEVRFHFGQRNGTTSIAVIISADGLKQFAGTLSNFGPGTRLAVEQMGLKARAFSAELLAPDMRPALLSANIVVAARSGRDAVLDFYYATPWLAHRAVQGLHDLDGELDAVVRVILPTTLLLPIVESVHALANSYEDPAADR